MTCDICKEQHQTWECPEARQVALDVFKALDIPSLRDGYMPVETAYLAALKRIAELEAALTEIAKGEGAFSRDRLTHAENCVDNMKDLAINALAQGGEGR